MMFGRKIRGVKAVDKRLIAILAAIVVLFAGIYALTSNKDSAQNSNGSSKSEPTSHVKGQGAKNVTLTEYGDFQCSVCFAYYPIVEQVVEKYKSDIKFQFRHLPLVEIHTNAFSASRAAEAAGMQGKFWEMYDQLYDNNNWQQWTRAQRPKTFFDNYARSIGLDMQKFNTDYASEAANDAINADISKFEETKLQKSTPTFFINGKHVPNSQLSGQNGPSVEMFSKVIDEAIKNNQNN